jgi:hypothetical protein
VFADRSEFTRAEVLTFYHHADPSLNPNTLDSRIRQLLQRGSLLAIGLKHYILAANAAPGPAFQPTLGRAERTIWRTLLPEGCL